LFVLRDKGYSLRAIAKALGRSFSTVSYELKRNAVANTYLPVRAQAKATVRRKAAEFQRMTIVKDRAFRSFNSRPPAGIPAEDTQAKTKE
jgi:IS30 family transposase